MLHKEDRTNHYLTKQVRRSGGSRPKTARARLEQEEKREASKQSKTPSRETKLYQVRTSIAKVDQNLFQNLIL